MTRKLSKGSIKAPVSIVATRRPQTTPVQKTKTKEELLHEKTEAKLNQIRRTPTIDRYGRAHYSGTPIGSGDKAWRKQHGIGAKYSRQCSMLGIGIQRDSFLPSECRLNEQNAARDTPRSTKISCETYEWAKRHGFTENVEFMHHLGFVQKRVCSVESLHQYASLSAIQQEELFDCIFKEASYVLLDKREPAPPMGTSTREQMSKATNWMGDTSQSASDVFYFPSFALTDRRLPRTVFGPPDQQEWIRKRRAEEAKEKEEAAPSIPHWSENTEMPQTMGTPNVDARIPTAPAFTFGTSERPPVGIVDPIIKNLPIYNVHHHNDPRFLPRYKEFGAKFRSMGYAEENRTKSRVQKSTEWGPPMPNFEDGKKMKSPTRFGLILAPKVSYSQYKLYS